MTALSHCHLLRFVRLSPRPFLSALSSRLTLSLCLSLTSPCSLVRSCGRAINRFVGLKPMCRPPRCLIWSIFCFVIHRNIIGHFINAEVLLSNCALFFMSTRRYQWLLLMERKEKNWMRCPHIDDIDDDVVRWTTSDIGQFCKIVSTLDNEMATTK